MTFSNISLVIFFTLSIFLYSKEIKKENLEKLNKIIEQIEGEIEIRKIVLKKAKRTRKKLEEKKEE